MQWLGAVLCVVTLAGCGGAKKAPGAAADGAVPEPPVAVEKPHVHTEHGVQRPDPFYWMRDRDNPEVIAHLDAENAYTDAMTRHLTDFRKALYDEMLGRIQETDLSVPVRDGPYFYYSRTEEGLAYPIYCRRAGSMEADEEVLLDVNELAEGHEYTAIGAYSVSPDHRYLAYSVDTKGREKFQLRVKDLTTGQVLPDVVDDVTYGVEWGNDNQTLFYTTMDASLRPWQVHRHVLGTDRSDDSVAYQEDDTRFSVSLWRTRSDAYLVFYSASSATSEVSLLDADTPAAEPRVVAPRHDGMEYDVVHHGDRLLINTNDCDDAQGVHSDCAVNFKLMEAPLDATSRDDWVELIAHRDDVTLIGVDAFADHLVITEREAGLLNLRVQDLKSGDEHRIEMPEPTYVVWTSSNPEFDTTQLRFVYSSLVTPRSVFDYDMVSRERELRKEQPVLGGYDRTLYRSERLYATAPDGVEVPISLVYREDQRGEGPMSVLLNGYGSYGASWDPSFSSTRLSLLDRGVAFAIAHVRGGGDLGRAWYEDGKFLHKKNTFTDFIACAEHLVQAGYTSSDQLVMKGGSAGGLLMGAVLNARPDLFAAAVAEVPFVDVVTTMLDESIPLTTGEWDEWGDPRQKEFFDYMLSYSPYDNVVAQDYPPLLVTSGLHDPRVQYWEPTKWVARLRVTKTDSNVVLLHTNMAAGHGGKSGRYGWLEDTAYVYGFLLDQLGAIE